MNFKNNFKKFLNPTTKEQLKKALNLKDDRTLRNYANGTRQPNLEQLEIIKNILNCTYDDLLED